jgi:hypothetical protein
VIAVIEFVRGPLRSGLFAAERIGLFVVMNVLAGLSDFELPYRLPLSGTGS